MAEVVTIQGRKVGGRNRPFLVAELSGNHQQDIVRAKRLISKAAFAGADAVKLQTYTPDTITLPHRSPSFRINQGLWAGEYLHDLYRKAMTPWDWHPELAKFAEDLGLILFSSPFDESAVDFLEESIAPPVYKVASFEITHLPLLRRIGQTGKPAIVSTGMATRTEIGKAYDTLRSSGCSGIVLLKCVSTYPADPTDYNLRSINALERIFRCPVGLSDHTIGNETVLGAIALGACLIEKHLTLTRTDDAVDSGFSLQPEEFQTMTQSANTLFKALGKENLEPTRQEQEQLRFRRSIFVSERVKKGEMFNSQNLRIVRPHDGLSPEHWDEILGKRSAVSLEPGTPSKFAHIT